MGCYHFEIKAFSDSSLTSYGSIDVINPTNQDNEFRLLRRKADVDGMADSAHTWYTVIEFHMLIMVPSEGADHISFGDAQPFGQGVGQLFATLVEISIVVFVPGSVR